MLKQTSSQKLQVCLSMCDLLLPPGIKGLTGNMSHKLLFLSILVNEKDLIFCFIQNFC